MAEVAADGVTVVIPCYNGAHLLPATLEHLARQKGEGVAWEIVLVDNASTDGSADVARGEWERHGAPAPLRVVHQPVKGIVAARNMGAEEATYEFIAYCDADNWLAPDYVRRLHGVLSTRPEVGVVGGRGEADFEDEPPPWFEDFKRYYAVGPQAPESGDVTETRGWLYGAGFSIRRSTWLDIRATGFESPLLAYERGSNDIEVCLLFRLAGARLWYDEELRFQHHLTPDRVTWPAFLRLVRLAHESGVFMSAYRWVLQSHRDRGRYVRPRRLHWLRNLRTVARKWVRSRLAAFKHRGKPGHPAIYRERRYFGECRGWWTVRDAFATVCDRIDAVRSELREGPDSASVG